MALKKLVVFHTNDIQDAPARDFSRLTALIRALRAGGTGRPITLDAGDGFQFFDLMKLVDYDAVALGNEDLTVEGLKAVRRASGSLPFVCANFELRVPGRSISRRPRWCQPYRIIRSSGLKAAVLGLVMRDDGFMLSKKYDPAVVVSDPIETARKWIPEARSSADVVIVLFHGWLPERDRLVHRFPEIDVVLSGHEHLIAGYGEIAGTIVGQAHSNIRSVGRLEVCLRGIWLDSWSGLIHPAESYSLTAADVDTALAAPSTNGVGSQVIAESLTDFRPHQYWLDINGNNVNLRPNTPLGNWLVDSIRSYTKADVAIQKAWGIQHVFGPGPIRESDVNEMIVYDEEIWVVGLRGRHLKAVLEYGFERSYNNLAFSGARLKVDYRQPKGKRVVNATVGGKRIDPNRVYRVATSEFLAGGNAGFRWMLDAVEPAALGVRLREFVVERLKEQGTLTGVKTGRLTEIGAQTD